MVQFTASEEHVLLVEQAKALLSRSAPHAGLDEIHLRAMRALVAELERQKYAVTARPRQTARTRSTQAAPARETREEHKLPGASSTGHLEPNPNPNPNPNPQSERESPRQRRQRSGHIPAAIRRAVFARDERRCTHTDDSGQRCRETRGLELHHSKAFARGGAHSLENVTLRCRAHNDLAAEQDFGRDFVELARASADHEPWAAQP
jgi:5-methylcytosine-specific restriction endonuclease McrA